MTETERRKRELADQIRDKAKELADLIDEAKKPPYNLTVTLYSGSGQSMVVRRSEIFGVRSVTETIHYLL